MLMKKNLLLALLPLTLAPMAIAVSTAPEFTPVLAAGSGYKKAALPTNIDLNPVEEADVRAYYSALNGKNLNGENLLKALKPILKNGQEYHSYDSKTGDIWKAYEITDRDWELSPASEITNGVYDATTNKITGYKYGDNDNKLDNPYLHVLYRNPGVEKGRLRAWDHHGDNKGIDREHIWAKSRGFGKDGTTEFTGPGARGDLHHLLPGDSYVNSSSHSNYYYGFVDPAKIADDAGAKYMIDGVKVVDGNYRGVSSTIGSGTVFEPQNSDKGDIARACFYMVARYNNLAGDDDTIDGGNPNLFLNDVIDDATIYSTPTKVVSYGLLSDLLAWHKMDPVDEYEIHRNDIVYRNFEKNRNPFVDFPEWVDAIWGTAEYDEANHKSKNRDTTLSKTANPSTDALHEGSEPTPVSPIKSITVQNPKTEYTVGDEFVPATVLGTDEKGKTRTVACSFTGYDMSKEGKQTVTVSYQGLITTTYEITVKAKAAPASIPMWVYIAVGAAALVIVILVAVWASKSKSRQKKVKKAVKKIAGSSGKKSSSKSKKK
ncbi:MAG: hypothetical protein E7179_04580 [Erysipelotrichaceae bacterium]|jgi:endonuclease I|nr:hypothetical protein [Erysipelotrichaceae bacterium]